MNSMSVILLIIGIFLFFRDLFDTKILLGALAGAGGNAASAWARNPCACTEAFCNSSIRSCLDGVWRVPTG